MVARVRGSMGCAGSKDGGGSVGGSLLAAAAAKASAAKDAAAAKYRLEMMKRHVKAIESLAEPSDKEAAASIAKARKFAFETGSKIYAVQGEYRKWVVPPSGEGHVPTIGVWANTDPFIGSPEEANELKKLGAVHTEMMKELVSARITYGKWALAKFAEAAKASKEDVKLLQAYEVAEIELDKAKKALAKLEDAIAAKPDDKKEKDKPKDEEKTEKARAKVDAAEGKVSRTKAAAKDNIEPGKAKTAEALDDAVKLLLIGYDKQHVIVEKLTSVTEEVRRCPR